MKKLIVLTVISLVALTACNSHENPLQKMANQEAANFLADADHAAEKALHYSGHGYAYRDCQEGKIDVKTCDALYQAMADYGRKKMNLTQLTAADIADPALWKAVKDDYAEAVFDRLPD